MLLSVPIFNKQSFCCFFSFLCYSVSVKQFKRTVAASTPTLASHCLMKKDNSLALSALYTKDFSYHETF